MLIDASTDVADGQVIHADVCLIGAGAAGISMALRLRGRGKKVLLLESGGFEPTPETDDLDRGVVKGDLDGRYVREGRVRAFGGSTNHWGGAVGPLDAEVFGDRPWVPGTRPWPVGRTALEPWYAAARQALDADAMCDGAHAPRRPLLSHPDLELVCLSTVGILRLGSHHRDALVADPDVTVMLHATATVGHAEDGRIVGWDVVAGSGTRFVVRAKQVVLAAGGLEIPRLVLASPSVLAAMPATAADHVGRHLMGHLLWPGAARLMLQGPQRDAVRSAMARLAGGWSMVGFTAEAAARHRVPNAVFRPLDAGEGPLFGERTEAFDPAVDGVAAWLHGHDALLSVPVEVQWEALPRPENRVTLDDDVDATGLPRLRVDARVDPGDLEGLARLVDAFDAALGAAGWGRVALVQGERPRAVHYDSHYLGTMRMADDPAEGVVDRDLKVHGLANLHVASSGVFPSGGWTNSTLTIVALALRLADRLGGSP